MTKAQEKFIFINPKQQLMHCYEGDELYKSYPVSTGKNGLGEKQDSGCTPRGWHKIHQVIGQDHPENAVHVARKWTGEIYDSNLDNQFPERDWILSRVLQLEGMEPGRNQGAGVDSLQRYIYIHGTPEKVKLQIPGSKGCIRMRNKDVIELSNWVKPGTPVCIEEKA